MCILLNYIDQQASHSPSAQLSHSDQYGTFCDSQKAPAYVAGNEDEWELPILYIKWMYIVSIWIGSCLYNNKNKQLFQLQILFHKRIKSVQWLPKKGYMYDMLFKTQLL